MKAVRATYWISTILFASIFLTTGTLYLLHNHVMVTKLQLLGYPPYVLNIIGVAKILGVIALLVPKFPRLKEWAYAGFVFDFIGAIWSHLVVQGLGKETLSAVLPLILVSVSYLSRLKLQASQKTMSS